jgi:hypothetical protein
MKTRNGGFILNRYTVILKSGKEFSFDALEAEVVYKADSTYKRIIEEIECVRWYGASGKIPLHINPAEVAAIYYERLDKHNGGDTVT